ncbi:MAG: hypothetical protein NVSMB40_20050 [Aquirhabdus sp.]
MDLVNTRMAPLITFVGFKSAGKNTAAMPLVEQHGFIPISFADAMKDSLAAIFCWDRELLEGITDESRAWRETVDDWWAKRLSIVGFTPRWAMRNFGTEVMRAHFNPEIWVFNVERRIMLLGDVPIVLIDARFPNEIKLARQFNGLVARIKRGPDPEWMSVAMRANQGSTVDRRRMAEDYRIHESEWAWVNCEVDMTLPNDAAIIDLQHAVLRWNAVTFSAPIHQPVVQQ